MRQLLILRFYCEVYRREPLCRVYVNDVCVEEFNIPHTANDDSWNLDKHLLDPAVEKNPHFIKFLELDDSDQRFMDLRIEINNNDNNYANGFMTRSTKVQLCQCWLVPVKIFKTWKTFDQIHDRWKFSRRNWHRYFDRKISIAQYYSGWRNAVFDNLVRYAGVYFPGVENQPAPKHLLKLHYSNYQYIPPVLMESPHSYPISSSGYIHLPLTKKLGFWRHRDDLRRGWWNLSMNDDAKNLYDKYKQYEDTRCTDQ